MKNRVISCVQPGGTFLYGIHKPEYTVRNLRTGKKIEVLGRAGDNTIDNSGNYPDGDLEVNAADWIYEIPNPFPFRGRTFIDKEWADASADNIQSIHLPKQQEVSLTETLRNFSAHEKIIEALPLPLQLSLATTSTDSRDLTLLAEVSCALIKKGEQVHLQYQTTNGQHRPVIHNHQLFEAVANNPHLPDNYKIAMVIRPGAQGASEIVGEWNIPGRSHVYEYLRRNSYIAGGHYAANMAEDTIRYAIRELGKEDITGLRHLYYQRSFIRLAEELKISVTGQQRILETDELEMLRQKICEKIATGINPPLTSTLWGWNFGFDYAPTGYRLHASHQQIHQQYAMLEETIDAYRQGSKNASGTLPTYSCGDLIAALIEEYKAAHSSDFFADYRTAIEQNKRMDERDSDSSLVVWQDDKVMLFVPKAQTAQWELQLMSLPSKEGDLPGNIIECNSAQRASLDTGLLLAQQILASLGARMVTSIEYAKRIGSPLHQPLLYSLLPRLPESPGAFSEAQLRFINGHYPEDFAQLCRLQVSA